MSQAFRPFAAGCVTGFKMFYIRDSVLPLGKIFSFSKGEVISIAA